MSLNPLMRIVKSTLNRDPIEEIFWGNPTAETYAKVLSNYKMFPMEMRNQTNERCLKKLSKPKQFDMVIANLALLQKLMKIDKISLPSSQPQVLQSSKKKQITMAEKSFVKFYFNFLNRQQQQSLNKFSSIDDKATFCQIGLNKCLDIIKNNIVIDYCLQHTANQVTLRIALKQIFEDIKQDMEFTISFINENIKSIYQKSNQTSFAINEVYQTLLFITKNIHKITVLIKKAGLSIPLPQYQMNKEINLRIEMEMNSRKHQKTKFKTQKLIKSKKNLQDQQEQTPYKNKTIQSLSQVDEDEIFIIQNEIN